MSKNNIESKVKNFYENVDAEIDAKFEELKKCLKVEMKWWWATTVALSVWLGAAITGLFVGTQPYSFLAMLVAVISYFCISACFERARAKTQRVHGWLDGILYYASSVKGVFADDSKTPVPVKSETPDPVKVPVNKKKTDATKS